MGSAQLGYLAWRDRVGGIPVGRQEGGGGEMRDSRGGRRAFGLHDSAVVRLSKERGASFQLFPPGLCC